MKRALTPALFILILFTSRPALAQQIVVARDEQANVQLAARETRRYLYLRTGRLLPIADRAAADGDAIAVKTDGSLAADEYRLQTRAEGTRRILTVSGGSDVAALYGAYALAEKLGVRFYLHGDVVPDRPIPFALPELNETRRPLFALRGVNPWGSHPFGFDAWSADDYKVVITQLAKMRMNFLGVHCYPEGHPFAEPTVWHGLPGEFDAQGRVTASYPAHYFNILITTPWGDYLPRKTGEFSFGGSLLFERDDWAPPVMAGHCPLPKTPEACNEVFNRMGQQFHEAFTFARLLGVKTCLGTETPLTVPAAVLKRAGDCPDFRAPTGHRGADVVGVGTKTGLSPSRDLKQKIYETTFRRIAASHPLDYYWLWTPEGWTWQGNKPAEYRETVADIQLAIRAAKNTGAPFQIATSGWVLGPVQDRAALDRDLPKDVPLSAISRDLGYEPIDPGFGRIAGRPKWAIPWLESDARIGLAAVQLFVGRTRRDAADALAYRCTGLMGLHWRTDYLAPNASALALAAWDQSWNTTTPGKPPARSLPCDDFYADWAKANFGDEAIGRFFAGIDGKIPPSVADGCPAGWLKPDKTPWDKIAYRFAFVDELEKLRGRVHGAGNLDRFDCWLNAMQYHRSLARLRCAVGASQPAEISRLMADAYRQLLSTVNTPGGLAMVVNLENNRGWGPHLAKSGGGPWPREYQGQPRIVVPAVRSVLVHGEPLALKIIVLAAGRVEKVNVQMRPLGTGAWKTVAAAHVNRGVWRCTLPPAGDDFEYYVESTLGDGKQVRWPVTSPQLNQTVVYR